MNAIAVLAKELALAAGNAAVDALVKLLRRRSKASLPPEPPHVTWRDVEHQRRQAEAATAHKVRSD